MKINVGNMSFSTNDEELRDLFSAFGTVASVEVVTDSNTNRSRGFGFVVMPDESEGNAAIRSLNGSEFAGRKLRVNEIKPSE
ncbi:RNA recognition motif, (aka RRM, RBD, or RNP domain) [Mariprofundus aestuarium]|uniref:RNA recognition motif, (Aka RRM, RBD, or RNP domain) n=1 Tax=Mariprofundus aestuarium TaxID=1921086 RepID=A0A2K8KY08_MARES|nr:RNA-binding protein [Mariprofundus aestuarium]ATX79622.1 RNA recognition motif, (aka RRM, RBD, or RNP domain) [Mariprofundus aestuarium]